MRLFRGLFSYTPTVELLYLMPLAIAMFGFIWFYITKSFDLMNVSTRLAVPVLIAACLLDNLRQIQFIAKKVWAKALGKFLFALTGALILIIASATAKQLVHLVTHIDPKYLPDAVNVITLAVSALSYAIVVSCLMFGWAVVQGGILVTLFFVEQSASMTGITKKAWQRAAYRFRTGRKAPVDYAPGYFDSGLAVFIMRPIGLFILITQFWSALADLSNRTVTLDRLTEKTIVTLEYKDGVSCADKIETNQATYVYNGHISVYDPNASEVKFSIKRCSVNLVP